MQQHIDILRTTNSGLAPSEICQNHAADFLIDCRLARGSTDPQMRDTNVAVRRRLGIAPIYFVRICWLESVGCARVVWHSDVVQIP